MLATNSRESRYRFQPIGVIVIYLTILTSHLIVLSEANASLKQNDSELPNGFKSCETRLNKITGKVLSLPHDDSNSLKRTLMKIKVLVNYGQYYGYPKEDGTFEIDNLPSDSYVVEISHPNYIYEPVRVDITSKGKIRARRVNYVQPSIVQTLDYPLVFKPKSIHNYFVPRETWRIMDLILNPMVIMMVVPLIIIWLLPKMMNPQEVQNQRDNMQLPEYNVPELSEMMASMFGRQPGQQGPTGQAQQREAILSASNSGGGRHGNKGKRR